MQKNNKSSSHRKNKSTIKEKVNYSSEDYKQKKDSEYAYYTQIIKSVWTHEPEKYFKVVRKSTEVMGEYIALHGFVPQNELPVHLRNKIPENEIWMREEIYDNLERRKRILTHEFVELDLMITYSISYKEAHKRAELFENIWYQK